MARSISQLHRIYLAIWRKAQTSSEPVIITAPNFQLALTMRLEMYRAIRPYRHGQAFDEILRSAADSFVVAIEKGQDAKSVHKIHLRPRLTLAALEAQLLDLGIDEDDLLLADERTLQNSLGELMAHEPRTNPFYTRED